MFSLLPDRVANWLQPGALGGWPFETLWIFRLDSLWTQNNLGSQQLCYP